EVVEEAAVPGDEEGVLLAEHPRPDVSAQLDGGLGQRADGALLGRGLAWERSLRHAPPSSSTARSAPGPRRALGPPDDVGEPEALPDELVDQQARLDLGLASDPVHGASDAPQGPPPPFPSAGSVRQRGFWRPGATRPNAWPTAGARLHLHLQLRRTR